MDIFVANLDREADEAYLRHLFSSFGAVTSCRMPRDREHGGCRGFAFVSMRRDDDALKAIAALDQQQHFGRRIRVRVANPD